jgi:hypothetical protein
LLVCALQATDFDAVFSVVGPNFIRLHSPRCERPKSPIEASRAGPAQRSCALVLEHDGSPDIVYVS